VESGSTFRAADGMRTPIVRSNMTHIAVMPDDILKIQIRRPICPVGSHYFKLMELNEKN
jgi:hypothetical protein